MKVTLHKPEIESIIEDALRVGGAPMMIAETWKVKAVEIGENQIVIDLVDAESEPASTVSAAPPTKKVKRCPECLNEFAAAGRQKYCSDACRHKRNNRVANERRRHGLPPAPVVTDDDGGALI